MWQRWRWVVGLVVALFAVNLVARLAVRVSAGAGDREMTGVGLVALVVVGLVALVAAARWVRRYPMPRAIGEVLLAVLLGCLLSVLIGPFVSAGSPFNDIGHIVGQFGWYLGICLLGMLFGTLAMMTLGLDVKSQSWKRYIQSHPTRPRAVRR